MTFSIDSPLAESSKITSENQSNSSNRSNNCDIIMLSKCENYMRDIQTTPQFHSAKTNISDIDLGQSVHEIAASLIHMSDRSYNKMFESTRGAELLDKADELNIPYIKDSINWLELINEVAIYETLLEEAYDRNIDWNTSEYDPVSLQQEIDYWVHQELVSREDLRNNYYASLGV